MRSGSFLMALLVVCWAITAQAHLLKGALVLGGLAALKGAALIGYAKGRSQSSSRRGYRGQGHYQGSYRGGRGHHGRYGRDLQPDPEGDEDLLSTVGRIDPNGCILKLVCQLQARDESLRSFEEELLVGMFANDTDSQSSSNTTFVYASDEDTKTHDAVFCKKLFPRCPLGEAELSRLLHLAWGYGGSALEEEAPEMQEAASHGTTSEVLL